MKWTMIASPLGELFVARDDEGITCLYTTTGRHAEQAAAADWKRDDAAFDDIRGQLAEYFAGARRDFDLPLHPSGTAFQQRAWQALLEIPFGATATYGEQARRLGEPNAFRAVGAANGQNPISIIVPCHRVIGASGALVGYGGGLDAKRWLLRHEAEHAAFDVGLFA